MFDVQTTTYSILAVGSDVRKSRSVLCKISCQFHSTQYVE